RSRQLPLDRRAGLRLDARALAIPDRRAEHDDLPRGTRRGRPPWPRARDGDVPDPRGRDRGRGPRRRRAGLGTLASAPRARDGAERGEPARHAATGPGPQLRGHGRRAPRPLRHGRPLRTARALDERDLRPHPPRPHVLLRRHAAHEGSALHGALDSPRGSPLPNGPRHLPGAGRVTRQTAASSNGTAATAAARPTPPTPESTPWALRHHAPGPAEIYHGPFEHLNTATRLVIVGITPSKTLPPPTVMTPLPRPHHRPDP